MAKLIGKTKQTFFYIFEIDHSRMTTGVYSLKVGNDGVVRIPHNKNYG